MSTDDGTLKWFDILHTEGIIGHFPHFVVVVINMFCHAFYLLYTFCYLCYQKSNFLTADEGDPKAPFSLASTSW